MIRSICLAVTWNEETFWKSDFFYIPALDELRNHLENPENVLEMKFLLLEQKYLEYLSRGNAIEALKVSVRI